MLVYGIRCNYEHLPALPESAIGDYFMAHNLLVFSPYSRPMTIQNHGARLTPHFVATMKRLMENSNMVQEIDLEQPYISDDEHATVKAVQSAAPLNVPSWYYIPDNAVVA